jgi:hypothetical protein
VQKETSAIRVSMTIIECSARFDLRYADIQCNQASFEQPHSTTLHLLYNHSQFASVHPFFDVVSCEGGNVYTWLDQIGVGISFLVDGNHESSLSQNYKHHKVIVDLKLLYRTQMAKSGDKTTQYYCDVDAVPYP